MHKKIGIIIFACIIIVLPILTLFKLPKEKAPFSENENRYLSEFPTVNLSSIKDETFMNGFDAWFSDRFYGREQWISAMNDSERLTGKTEISTVYTKDDRMMQVLSDYDDIGAAYDADKIHTNLAVINSFAAKHPEIPTYFMLCPTSVGVYGNSLLPSAVKNVSVDEKDMIESCYNELSSVTPINIYNALKEHDSEYIYYRTDHHWTSLGAYYAYQSAGAELGYTPYELKDFTKETASTEFQGTLFSKTLDQSVTKDEIDFYTLADNSATPSMTTSNGFDKEASYDSIFFRDYLDVKDKYASYTGQNVAVATLHRNNTTTAEAASDPKDTAGTDKRSILVIKDSYANSMMQFLINNYDTVTMIDLRYTNQSISNLVNVEDYDQVLFLYNCITFSDENDLIKAGL